MSTTSKTSSLFTLLFLAGCATATIDEPPGETLGLPGDGDGDGDMAGDGDGDMVGDGDGDTMVPGDGDGAGDGDGDTSTGGGLIGDGDGDASTGGGLIGDGDGDTATGGAGTGGDATGGGSTGGGTMTGSCTDCRAWTSYSHYDQTLMAPDLPQIGDCVTGSSGNYTLTALGPNDAWPTACGPEDRMPYCDSDGVSTFTPCE